MGPWSNFTQCDRAQDFLTKSGLSFKIVSAPGSKSVDMMVGSTKVEGWDNAKWTAALKTAGYSPTADKAKVNWFMAELILVIMVLYVTMVYGPIAAFLVELFPARIRYTRCRCRITSATAGSAACCRSGDGDRGGHRQISMRGLWYPIVVAVMTLHHRRVVMPETRKISTWNRGGRALSTRLRRGHSENLNAATSRLRRAASRPPCLR